MCAAQDRAHNLHTPLVIKLPDFCMCSSRLTINASLSHLSKLWTWSRHFSKHGPLSVKLHLLQACASLPLTLLPTVFLFFSFSSVPSEAFHLPSSHSYLPFLARQLKIGVISASKPQQVLTACLAYPQGYGHPAAFSLALKGRLHNAYLPAVLTERSTPFLLVNFSGLAGTPSLPSGFYYLTNIGGTGQ